MFENLSKNLNLLMTEVRISADELGRRINLPASTIKKIRNNNNPNPTLTSLTAIADFFSITLSQLVGDAPLSDHRIKGAYHANPEIFSYVPLLSWEEAARWSSVKKSKRDFIATEYNYGKNAYALIVKENDWENLTPGTALLIDPSLKPDHRDFIIVLKKGQLIPTLKQVIFDEDQVYLKSVIRGCHITHLSAEHKLLGVVVEYKKCLRDQSIKPIHHGSFSRSFLNEK